MNPSFFEGKDFTRAHRALHFLKEMFVARSFLFLMEKIARRVAMPFCFCWKWHRCIVFRTEIDGLNRISVENKEGLEHLGPVIAHTDIIHVV